MGKKGVAGMSRVIGVFLFVLLSVAGMRPEPALAWFGSNRTLVTINGTAYSNEDFKNWWRNWREKDTPLPESPDSFIAWHLLAQEANRMQLFREPDYRGKVNTFLKVRSLMLLKNEEIDGRIVVSDQEIQEVYRQQHTPRLRVRSFFYPDEAGARKGAEDLRNGVRTADELMNFSPEEGGSSHHEERWLRVPKMPEQWRQVLAGAKPGDVLDPIAVEHGVVFVRVEECSDGDAQDMEPLRAGIEKELRTRKSHELTVALVERLKEKFSLRVDEEVLAAIGEEQPDRELAAAVLISSSQGDITAGDLWNNMRRERAFREKNRFQAEEFAALKGRVLASIIAQTVVSWEAMDRKYQEKEPFKWVYRFYCEHRLNKQMEKRFVEPEARVTEEEMERFYQENIQRFTQPETVSFLLLEGEEPVMQRIWQDISSGRDFSEVAVRHVPGGPPVQRMPVNHLDRELADAIAGLRRGEVSRPFALHDHIALVRLVNHSPAAPLPLESVREQIREELGRDKYRSAREKLVRLLKERSDIHVNQKVWNSLRKELEKNDAPATNS